MQNRSNTQPEKEFQRNFLMSFQIAFFTISQFRQFLACSKSIENSARKEFQRNFLISFQIALISQFLACSKFIKYSAKKNFKNFLISFQINFTISTVSRFSSYKIDRTTLGQKTNFRAQNLGPILISRPSRDAPVRGWFPLPEFPRFRSVKYRLCPEAAVKSTRISFAPPILPLLRRSVIAFSEDKSRIPGE